MCKRHICRLAAVSLSAALLSGCFSQTAASVQAAPSSPQRSLSESAVAYTAPPALTWRLETELLEEEFLSADGIKVAQVSMALPVLRACRADGAPLTAGNAPEETAALAAADAFNANFDSWRISGTEMETAALAHYDLSPELFVQYGMYYAHELTYTAYTTDRLVSILGNSYSYYGGAHPNTIMLAWNFDLEAGAFIAPSAIAGDAAEFEAAVTDMLILQARSAAEERGYPMEELYWEDYQSILADWTSYTVSFDEAGMTVTFSPYELGCYAAGTQAFTLSYTALEPYLSGYGCQLLGLELPTEPSQ